MEGNLLILFGKINVRFMALFLSNKQHVTCVNRTINTHGTSVINASLHIKWVNSDSI